MIPVHDGVAAIEDDYDAFILDLWGVLHDGTKAYPGVPEALTRLHARGKKIACLSNAPRRIAQVEDRMVAVGVPKGKYDMIMSSGEDTWRHLRDRPDAWYRALGPRCFHLGPERDENLFEETTFERVRDLAEADFIVNSGPWGYEETLADHEDRLREGARRGLKMICANPDLEVMVGLRIVACAGLLARRYEEFGGEVRYHGKPHPSIYDPILARFADVPKDRICAIGDTLRTDIAGANAIGIDSFLVTGGIHAVEFGVLPGERPEPEVVAAAVEREGHRPTGAMVGFR